MGSERGTDWSFILVGKRKEVEDVFAILRERGDGH